MDRPDIRQESPVLFRDIARSGVFPRRVSYPTVYRWAKYGKLNQSGVTVYLEYIDTPTGMATTEEACVRFLEALNQ